jgi:putative transcriptional regulator
VAFVGADPEAGKVIPESGGDPVGRSEKGQAGRRSGDLRLEALGTRSGGWVPETGMKATRVRKRQTVGESIIQGLKEAIAWTKGEHDNVRATLVHVPEVDVREVRLKMGVSQAQFATKFGFPPGTPRNWEQGGSHPDAPTRVLLAVIAKHPEAVEDVLHEG